MSGKAIELNESLLEKIHCKELEMLIEIDRICKKHKIAYSLDGGTLLGAIRHGGFIPWDDDADVVMLRSEYERFYNACLTDLDNERFFLQEYRTDKYYRWGYSKLRRNGTIFLRDGQEHLRCHQGLFVDIFICDSVPKNYLVKHIHYMLSFCIRKGQYSVVGKYKKGNIMLRIIYGLLAAVPNEIWVTMLKDMVKVSSKIISPILVGHLTYPYPSQCRFGIPLRLFKDFKEREFEGHSFSTFKDSDQYLRLLYGNYMELPSESARKTHPVSKLIV